VTINEIRGPDAVVLDVCDFGERYAIAPRTSRAPRHPLLEAAVDSLCPPPESHVEISIRSAVPPGSSVGTSAAVAVAILGALQALRGTTLGKLEVALAAHRLEVDALGRESGVQDQLASAFGGINYIEIDDYPAAVVRPLPLWDGLSGSLTLVFVGPGHDSSSIHRQVIEDVARRGPGAFAPLRAAAGAARDAVLDRDLLALGRAMIANTEAQAGLHPSLIGAEARKVMKAAAAQGAIGWKVNGAGGNGGSVTLLSRTPADRTGLEEGILGLNPEYRIVAVEVSGTGLEISRPEG
jgi:D-glycero-alpha-D-manno-heptose-7-phosphate kinase